MEACKSDVCGRPLFANPVTFIYHQVNMQALLPKHSTKDRDTLIEQSSIRIYQQINGSATYKVNKQELKI